MFEPPEDRWWVYGEYTGGSCPKCGRERMMTSTDNAGNERVICENCHWEPAKSEYVLEAND